MKFRNMTDIKNEPAQAIRVDYPESGSEYYYGYTKYEDALLKITCAVIAQGDLKGKDSIISVAEYLTDAYFNSLTNKQNNQ
jgi:hypothetical protein